MLSEKEWNRLTSFVAGETPPAEQSGMEQWLQEDPERECLYTELREIWMARGSDVDVASAWIRFSERVKDPSEAPQAIDSHGRQSSLPPWPVRWSTAPMARAAVIGALVLSGGILARHLSREPSAGADRWETAPSYVTGAGELRWLSLQDGTEVLLGVRSDLQVASGFGVDTREVRIHGEAFFRATADARLPFIVHTTESRARVVGTGFSVRSRGEGTEVIVREGTVLVVPLAVNAEAAELKAGTLGHVSSEGRSVEVKPVDLDERLAWMEGRLVFRNARLREVLHQLEFWYDVDFRVEGAALPERRLTAFLEHPPLGELLTAIALAVDASYSMDGSVVRFSPRP